jgi:hypothetical protein
LKWNHPFLKEEYFVANTYIWKKIEKNHKLKFQENITTIIIAIDYNFDETFKNMSLEKFKIV